MNKKIISKRGTNIHKEVKNTKICLQCEHPEMPFLVTKFRGTHNWY